MSNPKLFGTTKKAFDFYWKKPQIPALKFVVGVHGADGEKSKDDNVFLCEQKTLEHRLRLGYPFLCAIK